MITIEKRLLLLLLVWALGLGIFFSPGFFNSDDISYMTGIQALAGQKPLPVDPLYFGSLRLGLTIPGWVGYTIFGSSVNGAALLFSIFMPLLGYVAFALGQRLHTPSVGLLAAFLTIHTPIIFFYSGALLPDNALAFWLGLAALLLVEMILDEPALRKGSSYLLGAVIGIGYTVKEVAVVALVPIGVSLLLLQRPFSIKRSAVQGFCIFLGLCSILAIETALLSWLSGDLTIRLLVTQSNEIVGQLQERMARHGTLPLERLVFVFERMKIVMGDGIWVAILGLIAYPLTAISKHPTKIERAKIAFWFYTLWFGLFLVLGTTSFSNYVPPPIQHQRYFAPVLLQVSVMIAAFAWLIPKLISSALACGPRARFFLKASCVTPLLLWGGAQLVSSIPDAGWVYRSGETKSFMMAYQEALGDPARLPVVIGHYHSRRMQVLFDAWGTRVPDRVVLTPNGTELRQQSFPPPPFLLIVPEEPSYFDRTESNIRSLAEQGEIELNPYLFGAYRSPKGRLNELAFFLAPLLGSPAPIQEPDPADRRGALLFKVEKHR